ncbi:zinc finger protein 271 [Rhipicephalus sanguineus]|uniref:zinc finger protein 271 n=1 Tax=Rhipicephalus sanguineus TaxID=34632 RepID=UPI0018935A6D|nr:zinc finger protein 271 [Rhipicephalus sanguineus]
MTIPVKLEPSFQQDSNEEVHLLQYSTLSDAATSHKRQNQNKCSYCGRVFSRKRDLDDHIRVHTEERPYACHLCPMTFRQKKNVVRHLKTHTGERPFKCRFCEKAFASMSDQNRHEVFCHRKSLHCHVNAQAHQNVAIPVKLEPSFQEDWNEEVHLLQHSGRSDAETSRGSQNPRKCNYCGKVFQEKYDLDKHLHVHTGERPFVCHLCPMTFTHKQSVARHVRTHTGEKPYQCRFCPKAFTSKSDQNRHEACTHTGGRPYRCRFCPMAFAVKRDQKRHEVSSHDLWTDLNNSPSALQ